MIIESETTSKTESCLNALLIKAWRERWTDLQWGVNIKTILPRGVSGDVYNLADCILQQAVVGAGANQLILSYLRHSLSAQLISHAAVLRRLSKYNHFSKIHCVYSLLELLEDMIPGVTCCGKPEETVLATAVLSIVTWLVDIMLHCKETANVWQKAATLFDALMNDDFYVAMMCMARYNDPDLFAETNRKCTELYATQNEDEKLKSNVKKLENLDTNTLTLPVTSEEWPGTVIQCWLEVKLVGNPATSTTSLCQQLRLLQNLKQFDSARLYAEIMRSSLLSLYDVNQTSHESQWGAFAFLKVPHILADLVAKSGGDTAPIVTAVELLLQHGPLLDAMDANSSCSSLEYFLGELIKARLMSDVQAKALLEKRNKVPPSLKLDTSSATAAGIPKVIICAEPTLTGILKTLSTDYHKIQDALLGILHQILAGKSFELILAVATVQNQLRTLVTRLIRFNECSKASGDKARAQLFDITFLMLVAIVQKYGPSAVLDIDGDSLFERWVKICMVERQKPKAPEQMLSMGDPATIEVLLQQFNSPNGDVDFKPTTKWQDVLFSMPGVMHEVLVAWEQGALMPADAKRILDAVRGRMCCLPLAAAAWLCAYMRTAPAENLLKPINMVQQLVAPPVSASAAAPDEQQQQQDSSRERWQLTCEIIRRMQRDVQLPMQTKSSRHLVSKQPAMEQLHSAWTSAMRRGWLDHTSTKTLHCLLDTAGPRWLVSSVVQELLRMRYADQLKRAVDLALAIFHVDIVACTLELLSHSLPQLLYSDLQQQQQQQQQQNSVVGGGGGGGGGGDMLMEPQLLALAKLTSACIYVTLDSVGLEDNSEPTPKLRRLDSTTSSGVSVSSSPQDQLSRSLKLLMSVATDSIQDGYITQHTYFAFYLIRSLMEVKAVNSNAILSAIPPALITDLLRTLPDFFGYPLLLRLHDIFSGVGRNNMAKDICILRNYRLKNVPQEN